ncbi:MAG: hypothetical protein ACK4RN_08545, partial [Pseudorhodobacter sp.]
AGPKLQGFEGNHTKHCRPWREKPQRFSAKSMVWRLFRANQIEALDPHGQKVEIDVDRASGETLRERPDN